MRIFPQKVSKGLEVFAAFLLLNIIWLLFCVPIITIFPATTAMFGVIRKWMQNDEIDYLVFKPFYEMFKRNFKKSFLIGLLWYVIATILLADVYFVSQITLIGKPFFVSMLMLLGLLFVLTTIYLFPFLVHYDSTIRATLKNALFLSIGRLGTSVICFLLLIIMAVFTYYFPLILWLLGSVTAYTIYGLVNKSFQFIKKNSESI